MKKRIEINSKLLFLPSFITIIFGIAFFVLPTFLKDSYNFYPVFFLLTIAISYLKLSFFLFSIFQNFTKNCTAFSLLVILVLTVFQLYALSLAVPFLTIESYPLNVFQFLGISQLIFFVQLFLTKLWQTSRLNLLTIGFYLVFWLILFIRPNFELRWNIVFYQFIAIFGFILELFSFYNVLKVFLKNHKNEILN